MHKKIISIFLIVCIILILMTGYFVLKNGITYQSKIKNVNNVNISELQLQQEQFEIVNQYCTKSNKNSSNPFIFYKELFVIELNTNNNFDAKNFINLNSLNPCTNIYNIKSTLKDVSKNNNDWIIKIFNDDANWYQTTCQFEDTNIKSSVNLYFVSTNSSTVYIILDQQNI